MPGQSSDPPHTASERQNVLVRARNGDVIRFDNTGLVLRLSDRVIADIALRLGTASQQGAAMPSARPAGAADDIRLEDVDIWDLVQEGDWLTFNGRLPGKQGVRRFRLAAQGGDVVADAPGALYAILGIGGARAALGDDRSCAFPQHILVPADDIGAVGHAGIARATETPLLEHVRDMTHEALTAEAFLNWQLDKHQPLPLFVTRVETDEAGRVADLAQGAAYENLMIAAANVQRAAGSLGKAAKLLAVTLDYSLEDATGSAQEYRDGVLTLMRRVEDGLAALGFSQPLFVTRFERGSDSLLDHHSIEGQWELVWNHGDHRLLFSAPGYMFGHDDTDRPDSVARQQMAEMTAAAASDPENWQCPTVYLAEILPGEGGAQIRLVAQAGSKLVLAPGNAPCADRPVGLRLMGDTTGATITGVEIDPDDPQTVLISLDRMPAGDDLRLAYAIGPGPEDHDPACIALRDEWALASVTEVQLHRWALPCLLPIHKGGSRGRNRI